MSRTPNASSSSPSARPWYAMSMNGTRPRRSQSCVKRFPLLLREVRAARVVATAVNQHELAGARLLEPRQHRLEIDAMLRVVVIRIGVELQARDLQQRLMVRPRRVADVDARARLRARDEMAGDAQAAAAAGRLHGRDAAGLQRRMILAVEELLDAAIEAGVAGDRDVRLAVLLLEDRFLGGFTLASTGVRPCSS